MATRFYAPTHPSLPNYLAMISGSTHGCSSDRCKGGYRGPTIARQLTARGLGWQGYFEGLPGAAMWAGTEGQYVRHHNPFVYFRSVTSKARQRRHLRTLRALPSSLRSPPALSYVVPNNAHNMHDGPIRAGDRWLAHWVTRVMHSRGYRHGGVIFIVWDEGHNDSSGCCLPGIHGGRIPLFIISRHSRGVLTADPPTAPPTLCYARSRPGSGSRTSASRPTPSRSSESGSRPTTSVIRAPPPARFAAVTVPPCASAIAWTMARPRPEPSRLPSPRLNG